MSFLDDFQGQCYVRAALAKLGQVPENFKIYKVGWHGDMESDACLMRLDGCVFRRALRGSRAGQVCIPVKGTEKTIWMTVPEVEASRDLA